MKFFKLYLLCAFVILVQLANFFIIYYKIGTWPNRGMFGDMFGAVNALFSGLAFAGIIYAIFLQHRELELQRNELELTRKELKRSARAQADQVEILKKTAKLNALSTKVSCHAQFASQYKDIGGTSSKAELGKALEQLDRMLLEEV